MLFDPIARRCLQALGLCVAVAACNGSTHSQSANPGTQKLATPVVTPEPAIVHQPTNAAVVAGHSVSFRVGASCNTGPPAVQWQRASGHLFIDIAGATSPSLTLTTAWLDDNGAQFQAVVSCSGTVARTSNVATLVVVPPLVVHLGALLYDSALS